MTLKNNTYGCQNRSGSNGRSQDVRRDREAVTEKPNAEPIPADYVDKAEEIMEELCSSKKKITTSKIRKILSFVSDVYNIEMLRSDESLSEKSRTMLTRMRIRIAYEAGRNNKDKDKDTKEFILNAKLLNYIKHIEKTADRKEFMKFCEYMEALVAYHRYYGGKD